MDCLSHLIESANDPFLPPSRPGALAFGSNLALALQIRATWPPAHYDVEGSIASFVDCGGANLGNVVGIQLIMIGVPWYSAKSGETFERESTPEAAGTAAG